jgi:hypothetical protein
MADVSSVRRYASDSVSQEEDRGHANTLPLRHAAKDSIDLSAVATLFVEHWLQTFVQKRREDDPVLLALERLPDDLRAQIVRQLRTRSERKTPVVIQGFRYHVEITDRGRSGFLVVLRGMEPVEPISKL